MRIRLSGGVIIDTKRIKQLRKKPIRLLQGLSKNINPKYTIEFLDNTFLEISKKEYKLLSKVIENEETI